MLIYDTTFTMVLKSLVQIHGTIILSVLATDYKAEARVLSYVLVQVCIGLIFYIYNAKRGKKFFDKEIWKFALAFNLPLIPHYLAFTVLNQADRIMISRMVDTGKAAIYGVAYSVSMMMTIFTNAINNSFIPYTYKALKSEEYNSIRKNSNTLLIFVGAGCILAMAFAPEIIRVFAAREYYEAIWVMPPVAASVYFMFLYPLFGNVEFYFEKTKYVTIASCSGAIANIILNYIFIKIFGYVAAGYTTLACYIIFAVAHYFFHKRVIIEKKLEIKEIYDIRFIVSFSVIVVVAMVGMTLTYSHTIIRYAIIVVIMAIAIWKRKLIVEAIKAIRKK